MSDTPADDLERIATSSDFYTSSEELIRRWVSESNGLDAVSAVFRFMEAHPNIDYGNPGPLVHFCERFYYNGYEEELVHSIDRQPTAITVWMLNRLMNGTSVDSTWQSYFEVLRRASVSSKSDADTAALIKDYLDHQVQQ